mmetsp:Transcript_31919/g.87892  ORF Transcript_31919/g.87892 Transcript_31919/m.87892 type:complete len:279 (-) Transcript_31919:233-1069(-)
MRSTSTGSCHPFSSLLFFPAQGAFAGQAAPTLAKSCRLLPPTDASWLAAAQARASWHFQLPLPAIVPCCLHQQSVLPKLGVQPSWRPAPRARVPSALRAPPPVVPRALLGPPDLSRQQPLSNPLAQTGPAAGAPRAAAAAGVPRGAPHGQHPRGAPLDAPQKCAWEPHGLHQDCDPVNQCGVPGWQHPHPAHPRPRRQPAPRRLHPTPTRRTSSAAAAYQKRFPNSRGLCPSSSGQSWGERQQQTFDLKQCCRARWLKPGPPLPSCKPCQAISGDLLA